jgi:O-antigen/teichoic acid export membrane protein
MPRRRAHKLLCDPSLRRLSWTLLDQGIVSAGAFVVQIALARRLPAEDYGVFALVFSGLMALQLCNATLLFHPMSVRVSAAAEDRRPTLLGASLILVAALSVSLCIVLAAALVAFGRPDLLVPALVFFVAWQVQEGLRRGLISSFRYAAAITGDATTYVGQALIVAGLSLAGPLSIGEALHAMAGTAALGAILHARQLTLAVPSRSWLRSILSDFWSIGGAASLGNGWLSQGRVVVVPWVLAALSGPAAAGGFQAAMNIVNLSNPLMLGLGNIIPQAAASACARGNAHAWQTARRYALIASPPIMLYSVAILIAPANVLQLFYGATSDYTNLVLALQLLVLVNVISFAVEAVLAFLHGITLVRRAAAINMAGMATSALLVFPLVSLFGLAGGCAAVLLANLVRLALANLALIRVTAMAIPAPLRPSTVTG